jgi:cytoskeletal protein CcmA (bactofilin family)
MIGTAGPKTEKAEAQTGPQLAPEATRPESLIDKHSSFNGHYRSTHNLRIEGSVDGEIECQSTLTIAENATVKAKVEAQNVIVGGSLEGEVTCPGRFQILPQGRVVGKVVAGTLEILAGAFYEGQLSMHPQSQQALKDEEKSSREQLSTLSAGLLYPGSASAVAAPEKAGTPPTQEVAGGKARS